MSDSTRDGGPAFPGSQTYGPGSIKGGMTLRDYFAAQAISGLAREFASGEQRHDYAAHDAYRFADAMLKAREAQ